MKISIASGKIEPSLSRELFNKAKQYDDVIDLTLGDPDLLPPETVRKAACNAVIEGKTRYSANAGLPELRDAYAARFAEEYGFAPDPSREVIATVGGMEALFLSLACIIDPGDEVIIFAPYYVNYVQMVRMLGGVPVQVALSGSDGFSFHAELLEEAVTDKTAAIIVNSPCNPTGTVLSREDLKAIADIVAQRDLVIISDEVYKTLLYDDKKHESIVTLPDMRERTVVVDSVSKRFSMTGYRVGFATGPDEIISNMTKMQENVAACAPLPSQYAAAEAYRSCSRYADEAREIFEQRRDVLCQGLADVEGLRFAKPSGAFYIFVDISELAANGLEFSYSLLEKMQVAVVPGATYGEYYSGYVRIAYTLDVPKLEEACVRIARFAAGFGEKR